MGFFLALRFLSIIPIPGKAEATERQLGRATAWYPVVGILLGALLYGCAYLFTRLWSPLSTSFLCLAVWTLFTRGLHLDGLADTFDGLGAGAHRDKRLAIMKDSRIGVFGVVALCLVLLGKFAILTELVGVFRIREIILVPALGRWSMLLAIFSFPSAVPSGLGFRVKQHCRWPQLIFGTAVTAGVCLVLPWSFGPGRACRRSSGQCCDGAALCGQDRRLYRGQLRSSLRDFRGCRPGRTRCSGEPQGTDMILSVPSYVIPGTYGY